MTDSRIHSQCESKLLSAPAEIRRAIYANVISSQIHAFLVHGRIQLSICLEPNLGDNRHDGYERKATADGLSQTSWARRLRSSWGPHWECEQVAMTRNRDLHEHSCNHISNLLLVCKRMFFDIRDFVTENIVINVTDLDTLQVWVPINEMLAYGPNQPWSLWEYTRSGIQKLNVTLRLPLAFYRALEEDEALVLEAGHDTDARSAAWVALWLAVCQLSRLHSLYVWLDHDDRSSWSVVKERIALHRVTAILGSHMQARTCSEEKNLGHLDIRFNLPKLHPRIARPNTHFTQDSAPPPFIIERRIRQRYFCKEGPSGSLSVTHNADFPVMYELPYFLVDDGEEPMTQEELEIKETKLWEEGCDVHQFMRDISSNMCSHEEPM